MDVIENRLISDHRRIVRVLNTWLYVAELFRFSFCELAWTIQDNQDNAPIVQASVYK